MVGQCRGIIVEVGFQKRFGDFDIQKTVFEVKFTNTKRVVSKLIGFEFSVVSAEKPSQCLLFFVRDIGFEVTVTVLFRPDETNIFDMDILPFVDDNIGFQTSFVDLLFFNRHRRVKITFRF